MEKVCVLVAQKLALGIDYKGGWWLESLMALMQNKKATVARLLSIKSGIVNFTFLTSV